MMGIVAALLAFVFARAECSAQRHSTSPATTASGGERHSLSAPTRPVVARHLRARVIESRHHDTSAFTQGLLLHAGGLYESTGLYGHSELRELDPKSGAVRRKVTMPRELFAEGLALVGDELIQLTWREHVALVYDRATFQKRREFSYRGEGWGLCYDGRRLVMSDGSAFLTFRDPHTFAVQSDVQVTIDGEPQDNLNELECVSRRGANGANAERVYANVWGSDQIVEIDPSTGAVTAVIDASGLISQDELERAHADVLNGIAYDRGTDHFLITGKQWPALFEVVFEPAAN